MIDRLVVFGATGDLSARYLLPGLAALHATGHLDSGFRLVGADRGPWDSERFRHWAAEQLDRHGADSPADARKAVSARAEYRQADVTDPADVATAIAGEGPVAVYLALPRRSSPPPSPPCTRRACRQAAGSCWRNRSARTRRARWN